MKVLIIITLKNALLLVGALLPPPRFSGPCWVLLLFVGFFTQIGAFCHLTSKNTYSKYITHHHENQIHETE